MIEFKLHPDGDPSALTNGIQSLLRTFEQRNSVHYVEKINLSHVYEGHDEFERRVAWAALTFENWATEHVDFETFGDVWPYYLDEHLGEAVLDRVGFDGLPERGLDRDLCESIARKLNLPLKA